MNKVFEHLYIGNHLDAENQDLIQQNNITHIVCLGCRPKLIKHISYLTINMVDSVETDIKQHFGTTNNFINNCIKNKQNVLVHCYAGISRSSSVVIAYLMYYHNMLYCQAFNFLKQKRNIINPNIGFVRQLYEYEEELKQNCCLCWFFK